ncbi:TPA: hypothetical protein DIV55_02165 [Patescibacteria group bacterium]|uniref:FemAB family protein n=1 Tax=Candidatus Gottesmanbacteria bacterium GW2011_GWA1_43_11 TaxID=1618436 RepID=A0A0G1FDY4_9BACT|nr:MAG: FemAB family protein [Candidatus Gottesmanbacteria bacterium GW2011_GWA1_43_11]HCS78527.1 hypothetical protein [Patescibacteria group bacterium]
MKLTVRSSTISEGEWDQFILAESPWAFFQSFAWGETQLLEKVAVARWEFLLDDRKIAQAQTILVKAKRGTFLHVRHGPVVNRELVNDNLLWRQILEFLAAEAKKENAWFCRIGPLLANTQETQRLFANLGVRPAPIHAMDAEYTWVLRLNEAEETILANMRKTTRYLIRQAEKQGVVVKASHQIEDFLRLYNQTAKRQRFVPHRGIEAEFAVFSKRGQAELLVASHSGQQLAAAVILYFGKQAIYHHGASIVSKISASYLLQWHAIKEAKKRGLEWYNFWGIAPEDKLEHPWQGITLFKKGFGGELRSFVHAHDLPVSPLYPVSATIEAVRKRLKHY